MKNFDNWMRIAIVLAIIVGGFCFINTVRDFILATEGKPEIRNGFALTWFFIMLCTWGSNSKK
jgi:hypothetical protein